MTYTQQTMSSNSTPSKIAFFLPDLRVGGAEHMMAIIASAIARRGYAVDFVLVKAEGGYLATLDDKVNLIDLNCASTYKCMPALIRYLRTHSPDILVSALDLTNMMALIARKVAGHPGRLFIRLDNTQSAIKRSKAKKWLEKMLIRLLYPSADGIIAVSNAVAVDFVSYIGKLKTRIHTIYNPIINQHILEKKTRLLDHPWFAPNQPPVILGIGRLNEQKNFELLIKSFASLHTKQPCRLLILGEGPLRTNLESLVKRLDLVKDVAMPGVVDNPYHYLANADLFVLSSNYEGLPTVLVEALACGCPVVSTDCPSGPREILDGGKYGPLVTVGDEYALASAMAEALSLKVQATDQEWLKQYSEETVVKQYMALFGLPDVPVTTNQPGMDHENL